MRIMGFALRLRWEWLRGMNADASWASLPSRIEHPVATMFRASVSVWLEDGASALFWMNSWLPQGPIKSFAPHLYRAVNWQRRGTIVKEALLNRRWVRDITGAHTIPVLCDYVQLWEILEMVQLNPFEANCFIWRWSPDSQYSVSSAYRSFFIGRKPL